MMKHEIGILKKKIDEADCIVVGAGSGLSTAAGFTYGGERFRAWFSDFEKAYGFHDMYSGVFYPFKTLEEYWGYFSRLIYINRYRMPPVPVYQKLLEIVQDKDYFVLSTNVDHCFQRAGFDKKRLFYTQGDYGLFQCSGPCHKKTYDNQEIVLRMLKAQGFLEDKDGEDMAAAGKGWRMAVPEELVPRCPLCGRAMTMNLRGDDRFVEDEGWKAASDRYACFLQKHQNSRILFLELGVGMNTPGIIKYPFWQMTCQMPEASYACINDRLAGAPREIRSRALCIGKDIHSVLDELLSMK